MMTKKRRMWQRCSIYHSRTALKDVSLAKLTDTENSTLLALLACAAVGEPSTVYADKESARRERDNDKAEALSGSVCQGAQQIWTVGLILPVNLAVLGKLARTDVLPGR